MYRSKVLSAFRSLHRVRKEVFHGDELALNAGRIRINNKFKKHANERSEDRIAELLTLAADSEKLLKKTVVQGKQREDGVYELRLTEASTLEKNTMFDPHADLPDPRKRRKKPGLPD